MAPLHVVFFTNPKHRAIQIVPAACLALAFLSGCSNHPPLAVVDHVDLPRYMGRWYEIAKYPTRFEKGCHGATADYTLRPDGKVDVVNRCRKGSMTGEEEVAKGVARSVDSKTNAKLKVWFQWPFEGNYWVIDLDPDYRWAVVGEPSRKYLWILSRTPHMRSADYDGILSRLPSKEYDPAKLEKMAQ